jgi:uncharacterized membrane protein YfcA
VNSIITFLSGFGFGAGLEARTFLIVCPLVFLAGFIDSIAGGGGLVSLPAYLLAGLPVHSALGTNKLSSIMGTAVASWRYLANRCVDAALLLPGTAAALGGSALGGALTLKTEERFLEIFLLAALPLTALYVLRERRFREAAEPLPRRKALLVFIGASFAVGAYDGFFGPGAGTFLILCYTGLVRLDPRIAAGNAKWVNLASNAGALAVFVLNRAVIFPLGLAAGLFSVAGAWLGSGLAIRRGGRFIRFFILAALALIFLKTLYDMVRS